MRPDYQAWLAGQHGAENTEAPQNHCVHDVEQYHDKARE
jgi:hypothetical protein